MEHGTCSVQTEIDALKERHAKELNAANEHVDRMIDLRNEMVEQRDAAQTIVVEANETVKALMKARDERDKTIEAQLRQIADLEERDALRERKLDDKQLVYEACLSSVQKERDEAIKDANAARERLKKDREEMNVAVEKGFAEIGIADSVSISAQEETIKSLREENNFQTELLRLITVERDELRSALHKVTLTTRRIKERRGDQRFLEITVRARRFFDAGIETKGERNSIRRECDRKTEKK